MKIFKKLLIAAVFLVLTKILVFAFIQNKDGAQASTGKHKAMSHKDLQTIVLMQNKNYPKVSDSGIRIEHLTADILADGKSAVTYHKTVLNHVLKDVDKEAMRTPARKAEVVKEYCSNPALAVFLKDGVSIRNIYRDEQNAVLAEYVARPQDCN